MIDGNQLREEFGRYLAEHKATRWGMDAALMHVCKIAYDAGKADGPGAALHSREYEIEAPAEPGLHPLKFTGLPVQNWRDEQLYALCEEMGGALSADQLWNNDEVMALNAELGLTMDQLSRLASAITRITHSAPPADWRERFSQAVYDDLAAADNQDVPLEEYPALILKVLDAVIGREMNPAPVEVPMPKPVAYGFGNTAITGHTNRLMMVRIDIPGGDQYAGAFWLPLVLADEAHTYGAACRAAGESAGYARGLRDAVRDADPLVQNGEVLVTVTGLTGSGKSAIAGEIEIMCRALGLEVEWGEGAAEKHLTHADWTNALEMYRPRVRIVEANIPRTDAALRGEVKP